MRRFTALLPSTLAALCLPAAAGNVSRGFNVTVDLNGGSGVRLEAPAAAPIAPTAAGNSVTVANALVIRTYRARALRLRLEIVDPAVKSVEVLGFGKPVHVEGGAASVLVRSEGADGLRTLSYVVHYGKDARQRARVPLLATIVP